MTGNVVHREGCKFDPADYTKPDLNWCPYCGVPMAPGAQVQIDPASVVCTSMGYPSMFSFKGHDGRSYTYRLRSGIATIYDDAQDECIWSAVDLQNDGVITRKAWEEMLPLASAYRFVLVPKIGASTGTACPVCDGAGKTTRVTNPLAHFDPLEDPEVEEEECDECGGTGEVPEEPSNPPEPETDNE